MPRRQETERQDVREGGRALIPRGSVGGMPSLKPFGEVCVRCRSAIDGSDPEFCTTCREIIDNVPKPPVGTILIRERTVIREAPQEDDGN